MTNVIPTPGLRDYGHDLAEQSNFLYAEGDTDALAEILSERSDKAIGQDDIERLLIAVDRANFITNREVR